MGALEGLLRLPARSRLGFGIGLAALVAVAVAAWLWSRTPDWRVLYSNLSDRDGGAIVAQLAQMGVPYRIAEGGSAILVPAAQVHDARLRLAAQGLPRGSVVGFELLENQRLGATQFQEQVNFQRGLEGELARTIQSLAAVRAARVHLAIPKTTGFLRERQKPSASVLVALHPGRTLERAQVAGIVHLVASSVPELSPRAVTIVDQHGALLSAPGEGGALDAAQLAYQRELEADYVRRILDIVEPVVGRGNVRAQVSLDLDFSENQSTAESFRPNQDGKEAAVRSQSSNEAWDPAARAAAGVPGVASNQPGAAAAAVAAGPSGLARREATVQYELDRTVRLVRQPAGAVKRVSAAVVVNHRRTVEEGKVVYAPLREEELAQIASLVREAIGFQKDRGDALSLANAPFSAEEAPALEEPPFWKRPETLAYATEAAKSVLAVAVVLALAFGLLRPLLAALATPPPAPPAETAAQGAPAASPARPVEDRLASARALARQDPKVVANVVKSWVSKDG